jgi:hypothetical protein
VKEMRILNVLLPFALFFSAEKAYAVSRPPLDVRAPEVFQTASFALG